MLKKSTTRAPNDGCRYVTLVGLLAAIGWLDGRVVLSVSDCDSIPRHTETTRLGWIGASIGDVAGHLAHRRLYGEVGNKARNVAVRKAHRTILGEGSRIGALGCPRYVEGEVTAVTVAVRCSSPRS
jgi:hypothetical protein